MSDEGQQTPAERFEAFRRRALSVHYLRSECEVRRAWSWVRKLDPSLVALDIETAFKKGSFAGPLGGSIRLLQLGLDEPDRGIAPQQIVIDCHHADPGPFLELLTSRQVETQIHNMRFELKWLGVHLGITVGNVYDTLVAFRIVQRHLKRLDPRIANSLLPGWESHGNSLGQLIERYLGMAMPKEHGASDWGRGSLSAEQLIYAATDVAVMPPLVAVVKPLIERIGIAREVDEAIARTKRSVAGEVERLLERASDDEARVACALARAQDRRELRSVERAARQMALTAEARRRLRELRGRIDARLPEAT